MEHAAFKHHRKKTDLPVSLKGFSMGFARRRCRVTQWGQVLALPLIQPSPDLTAMWESPGAWERGIGHKSEVLSSIPSNQAGF